VLSGGILIINKTKYIMATLTNTEQVIVELSKNLLTDREDDFYGRVVNIASVSEDELIERVVKSGTDIHAATLKASYDLLKRQAIDAIVRGEIVSFGLGHIALDVHGTFIGQGAQWDSKTNRLAARITASKDLRERLAKTPVHVLGEAPDNSVINSIADIASDTVNDKLPPGGIANIKGNRIKITGTDPTIGLYFTEQETKEETPIPSTAIGTNDPSKISFVIPASIVPGDYLLSIVTQYSGGGKERKDPKTIVLNHVLTVE
jgi:hypothetical protein